MTDLMGLIYTGENDSRLRELTLSRAVAALPVVGRYRIIDFQMSSLVNSGVRNVGVITQRNYHSLMDHLGSGKEWDLHGKHDGLFILPPFLTRHNIGVYEGMLDALRSNIGYLHRSRQEFIALTDSHIVYNLDFAEMLRFHVDATADITVLFRPTQPQMPGVHEYRSYFEMDGDGVLQSFEIDPTKPHYDNESLNVLIIRRELLINLITQTSSEGRHSFVRDVLQRAINEHTLRVVGYKSPVRAWPIDSVQSYYDFNMQALKTDVRAELFNPHCPIYTKVRDDMPARYDATASVSGSLIADGGRIEGRVENSVIFRGVTIGRGAVIRNSIIMQDARVHEDVELDHCILDKQATIRKGGRLIGPATYPIVISKSVTI